MRAIALTVEYDGTDFHGFALQSNVRTVQGVLTKAVQKLLQEETLLFGASRTDAGVHARAQTVHFHTGCPIPVYRIPEALNKALPPDLKVRRAWETNLDFHARFSAKSRVYHYTLYCPAHPSVWQTRYACHYPFGLNMQTMQTAADQLVGTHNFRAFAIKVEAGQNCERTLFSATVQKRGYRIVMRFEGTAFLRGMVRLMAGSLVLAGREKMKPDTIGALLRSKEAHASLMMPPQGLCLMKVNY